MKIIDLTHEFIDNMSHSAYDTAPTLNEIKTVARDGYKDSVLTSSMHIGTHVDAPAHMLKDGKTLLDYPLDKFIGSGCVFDCRGKTSIGLTAEMKNTMKKDDMVVLYTGSDLLFNEDLYYEKHPVITIDLAEYLVKCEVKCLVMDFFSPDKHPFDVHKLLLKNDILLVENIKGANKLLGLDFELVIAPLKMRTGGAFARVFAQIK